MRYSQFVVPWENGLHARPASRLARLAQTFASNISFACNGHLANGRSILSMLLLCATMGATVQVEVFGDDEEEAIIAIARVFQEKD